MVTRLRLLKLQRSFVCKDLATYPAHPAAEKVLSVHDPAHAETRLGPRLQATQLQSRPDLARKIPKQSPLVPKDFNTTTEGGTGFQPNLSAFPGASTSDQGTFDIFSNTTPLGRMISQKRLLFSDQQHYRGRPEACQGNGQRERAFNCILDGCMVNLLQPAKDTPRANLGEGGADVVGPG
eukprot:jgi/Botrbrau1/11155/Bobra.182_2s0010.1